MPFPPFAPLPEVGGSYYDVPPKAAEHDWFLSLLRNSPRLNQVQPEFEKEYAPFLKTMPPDQRSPGQVWANQEGRFPWEDMPGAPGVPGSQGVVDEHGRPPRRHEHPKNTLE